MLRRAVLPLLFGAWIPILALSYMAVRSVSSEQGEEQRKAQLQAQRAAEAIAARLDEKLGNVGLSLQRHAVHAVRDQPPGTMDDLAAGETTLNPGGRALADALDEIRSSEPLVRQAFVASGGKLLHPRVHKAPPQVRLVSQSQHDEIADKIYAASNASSGTGESAAELTVADRTLYYAMVNCPDPGLQAALSLARADVQDKMGFPDTALKLAADARASPDVRGVDDEPIFPLATLRYAMFAEKTGDREGAFNALLELADAEAEDRWNQKNAEERRESLDGVFAQAERLAAALDGQAGADAGRKLRHHRIRAAFLDGFEPILQHVKDRVPAPAGSDPAGPLFRYGTTVGEKEPRIFVAVSVAATIAADPAPLASARPVSGHKPEPRFLIAGVDLDFERLRRWAEGEIAAVTSQTEEGVHVAIYDFSGDTRFAGSSAVDHSNAAASVAFAKELAGWQVLAAPSDPDAPARAARRKLEMSLALVATCALVAVVSYSFALRAAAREVEVAKVRTDLVRNVSHELRTPVASIQMLSEILEEGGLDATKQGEYFARIAREARRLSRLIENVLDLARVERGARKVDPQPLPLGETVEGAVLVFRDSEQGREANVVLDDRSEGAVVPLDAVAIEQILANLLSNAVKYSPPRSEIKVECALNGTHAKIVVRDRGRGMTAEEQRRLFNPFYRARPEDAAASGVGLGLVITRELIRLHQGELEVESEAGRGTSFTISLPRGAAQAKLSPPASEQGVP